MNVPHYAAGSADGISASASTSDTTRVFTTGRNCTLNVTLLSTQPQDLTRQ